MTDDIGNKDQNKPPNPFSRREFIAATGGSAIDGRYDRARAGPDCFIDLERTIKHAAQGFRVRVAQISEIPACAKCTACTG